jgi:hypothetical protein
MKSPLPVRQDLLKPPAAELDRPARAITICST